MKTLITFLTLLITFSAFTKPTVYNSTEEIKEYWDNIYPANFENNQDYVINGTVEATEIISDKKISVKVNTEDTLVVLNDFNLIQNSNSETDLLVEKNAVVIVFGDFNANHNLDIVNKGTIVLFGDLTTGKHPEIDNICGGEFYIFGDYDSTIVDAGSKFDFIFNEPDIVEYIRINYPMYFGPLPVELSMFNVIVDDNNVEIEWSTQSETNNNYFSIERSTDGVNFTEIDVISGNGTVTSQSNYITYDRISQISYYRLKQVDYDGHHTYSNVVTAVPETNLNVYPNVIRKGNYVNVSGEYTVIDSNGNEIYSGNETVLYLYESGVYFIKSRETVKRVVVQ